MAKKTATPPDIAAMVKTMKANRLTHLEANGIVLDMHPSAFEPLKGPAMQEGVKDDDVCQCGHNLQFEHNSLGCLKCVDQCGEEDKE